MRLPERDNLTSRQSAGEEFVKKIGLFGAILFIILSILGTLLMVLAGRGESSEAEPTPDAYVPPSAYVFPSTSPRQPFWLMHSGWYQHPE